MTIISESRLEMIVCDILIQTVLANDTGVDNDSTVDDGSIEGI